MINIERENKIDIISFKVNNINALIVDDIKEKILKTIDASGSKIIIDLKGVNYIDSSGFGCFLSLVRAAKNNYCILKFASPEPRVKELLETLHLQTVFIIYNEIEACKRSF